MTRGIIAGIDAGGTFTDLVPFDPAAGPVRPARIPTTLLPPTPPPSMPMPHAPCRSATRCPRSVNTLYIREKIVFFSMP